MAAQKAITFCLLFLLISTEIRSKTIDVSKIPKVTLNDGKEMPAIGLGTWLGHNQQVSKEPGQADNVQKAVEYGIDAGYRHIDTAKIYGIEDQVGKGIANKIKEGKIKREDLFVTTKLWNNAHSKDKVIPALKDSLKTLGLTYVDLYLIHWPISLKDDGSIDNTDFIETWKGMIEAQKQGLTKSIGVSNFNQQQLERLIEETGVTPAVNQVELNLNLQQPDLLKFCKSKKIAVVGYTPFGSLFYSKAAQDAPAPRVDDPQLQKIAKKYGKNTTQVNLKYLMQLGVIPIPKSVTKERIEDNLDLFDFELDKEDMEQLLKFDKGYRTIKVEKWMESPYYPFAMEKNNQ